MPNEWLAFQHPDQVSLEGPIGDQRYLVLTLEVTGEFTACVFSRRRSWVCVDAFDRPVDEGCGGHLICCGTGIGWRDAMGLLDDVQRLAAPWWPDLDCEAMLRPARARLATRQAAWWTEWRNSEETRWAS